MTSERSKRRDVLSLVFIFQLKLFYLWIQWPLWKLPEKSYFQENGGNKEMSVHCNNQPAFQSRFLYTPHQFAHS